MRQVARGKQTDMSRRQPPHATTARRKVRFWESPLVKSSRGREGSEGEVGKITYLHPTLHCARQTSHRIMDNGDKTAKIAFRSVQNEEIGPVSMNYYNMSLWFFVGL